MATVCRSFGDLITRTTTSGRPQDRERLNNPKYRRDLYVSSFTNTASFFSVLMLYSFSRSLWRGLLRRRGDTSLGTGALQNNTTGSYNTASGVDALFSNTTGSYNTASGVSALFSNTTGSHNTASGVSALLSNTTGSYNTASGVRRSLATPRARQHRQRNQCAP